MRTGEVLRYQGKRGTVWRLRYRDASGRRVRETLGREADGWNRRRSEAALRERLSDVDRGYRRGPALAFEAFARWWLDEYLPGRALKDSTLESYRTAVERHLVPALGGYAVAELEAPPELIDGFVANAVRAGLAPKTVSNLVLVLRVMLKQAVRRGLLRTNPAAGVERPRPVEPDMQVLTDTEIARLWTAYGELEASAPADERPWWATVRRLVFVALGTALRRGKLLALRWRDVELLEGRLHVRAALVRGRETTPKSRAGRRTLDLGSRTAALLPRALAGVGVPRRRRVRLLPPHQGDGARPIEPLVPLPPPRAPQGRNPQAVPRRPRPPPHGPHARSGGRESGGLRAAQGRAFSGRDHRALHPRRPGALPRRRPARRGSAVRGRCRVTRARFQD